MSNLGALNEETNSKIRILFEKKNLKKRKIGTVGKFLHFDQSQSQQSKEQLNEMEVLVSSLVQLN